MLVENRGLEVFCTSSTLPLIAFYASSVVVQFFCEDQHKQNEFLSTYLLFLLSYFEQLPSMNASCFQNCKRWQLQTNEHHCRLATRVCLMWCEFFVHAKEVEKYLKEQQEFWFNKRTSGILWWISVDWRLDTSAFANDTFQTRQCTDWSLCLKSGHGQLLRLVNEGLGWGSD